MDSASTIFSFGITYLGEELARLDGFGQKDTRLFKSLPDSRKLVGREIWVCVCDTGGRAVMLR